MSRVGAGRGETDTQRPADHKEEIRREHTYTRDAMMGS